MKNKYLVKSLSYFLLLVSCSVSNKPKYNKFHRQCFEIATNGKCNRINHIILGFELDYEFKDLKFEKDVFSGSLIYIGERPNPKNGTWRKLAYGNILNIYKLDTINCSYKVLGTTGKTGNFKVEANNSTVFAFSHSKIDTCCTEYLDCLIISKD